jgi:hypothetical protein
MAGIRFSTTIDTNTQHPLFNVELLSSNNNDVIYYNKTIKRIEPYMIEPYDLKVNSLVGILQDVHVKLSQKLVITHSNGSIETFDKAVEELINGLGTNVTPEFIDKLTMRKAYARYYYEMFKTKVVRIDEKNSDGLILTGLVSYYFLKRLVHVFVMCTIYQKVATVSLGTKSNTQATVVVQENANFATERNELQAKILSLEAEIKNTENLSASSIQKLKDMSSIQSELEDKYQVQIKDLEQQVSNYRDLLIKSTTMIFKLDEIPNVALSI